MAFIILNRHSLTLKIHFCFCFFVAQRPRRCVVHSWMCICFILSMELCQSPSTEMCFLDFFYKECPCERRGEALGSSNLCNFKEKKLLLLRTAFRFKTNLNFERFLSLPGYLITLLPCDFEKPQSCHELDWLPKVVLPVVIIVEQMQCVDPSPPQKMASIVKLLICFYESLSCLVFSSSADVNDREEKAIVCMNPQVPMSLNS